MPQSRRKIAKGASIVAPLLALGLGLFVPQVPAAASPPAASAQHNGQDDFDFLFGRWKVHLKRKVPGTDRWTDSDGYGNYRKIWGGRANINEFFSESPNEHLEGLTLRTYNPVTHLWSVYWANSRDGILSSAQVGKSGARPGRILCAGQLRQQGHPGALRLVQDHTGFGAFRAGVFGGRWQELGGQLDLGHDAHRRY